MDIDIGIIDRIKIWHENSSLGAAWFLESVIIRKKYSTCHIISNVYLQRIEHLCRYFYRQASEPTKKDPVVRRNLRNDEDHGSISHQSLKPKYSHMNGSNNRLENSRSILRSPTVYDKVNFRKKVSWDEQSIGSQDDAHSIDSQRMKPMQTIDEQQSYKRDSFSQELNNQTNHEILWISSHNFADNKWKIKSIEETNSFNLDSSTRTLLRSDRLLIDSSIQKSANEDQDEIYEFQANFWLKKDKPNDKLEAYLTPQSIHQSSLTSADVNIDSKKKHRILSHVHSDAQHQKFENQEQSKFASPNNLKTVENFPKSSSSHNLRLLSSQLPNASKTPLGHSKSFQENLNSPAHLDTTLRKQDESPRTHSAADKPAQLPLTPRLKSLRNSNDFTNPLNSEEELLARITTNEQSHHPRSTEHSLLSSNQHSKFRLDRVAPIISEQSSSMKLLNQPRSSTEHLKSSQKTNLLIPISANAQNPLPKTSHDSPNYSRPTTTAKSLSSRTLTSLNDINDCQPSSRTTEEELLKRITNQSSYRSQQSTNSLSPLTPRAKSTSNIDNLTSSSMTKREALLKMPVQSLAYSRSTMPSLLSSSLLSKSLSSSSSSPSSQFNNDFGSSLSRTSTEPTLRSKPPMRLNPDTILQKPMNSEYFFFLLINYYICSNFLVKDQVHHSAYGTSPSDDF
ncbi:unnamed protein product [Rotaria socialis]|uniref:PLAT domain-containing protein n=1 Tax=Rotaria socialis TaxID=392032 RepID=A0A818UL58_9BILA|nr:unnamed protein product [Rotaria socialis]CAF3698686.1 unnamed protein product [Rotaria socialis]